MSIFGDILGFVSGFGKKNAIGNATDALVGGYNQGINTIGNENTRIQGYLNPYMTAGDNAVGQEQALLGLGDSAASRNAIERLRSSPIFQSILSSGNANLLGNASATGGLRGGNMQDALARFGGDALAQFYQQQLGNLFGLSGQGLNAINSSGQFGANAADNIASLQSSIGKAQAGGILGKGAVDQQLWGQVGNTVNDVFNSIAQGFGGFGGFGGGGNGGAGTGFSPGYFGQDGGVFGTLGGGGGTGITYGPSDFGDFAY